LPRKKIDLPWQFQEYFRNEKLYGQILRILTADPHSGRRVYCLQGKGMEKTAFLSDKKRFFSCEKNNIDVN